eukprot:1870422-Rhodomonas_salina.2
MAGSGMTTACIARLNKEMRQLVCSTAQSVQMVVLFFSPATLTMLAGMQEVEPPPGVSAWPKDNKINNLEGRESLATV